VEVVSTTPNGILLQLSVAVTVGGDGTLVQLTLVLAGTPDKTGPVTSVTVIVCVATNEFPQAFVADHVLVIT
jgi:hypothetical protein